MRPKRPWLDGLGIKVASGTSFFSRFTMKFVEVVGAGAATAITGYFIAHLGGSWSAPAPRPAALETLPSITTVTKASRVQPATADAAAHGEAAAPAKAAAIAAP